MPRSSLALLTVLLLSAARVWPGQVKTSGTVGQGSPSAGSPAASLGSQAVEARPGLAAPGLVPSLGAQLGTPAALAPKTAAPTALPLVFPQAAVPSPAPSLQSQPAPSLPQSLLPAPGPVAAAPEPLASSLPEEPASAAPAGEGRPGQARGPPGTGLIERAQATAASLAGQTGVAAESSDARAARRYIRDIMGRRVPTEAETEVLLQDFMDLKGISAASARGQTLRGELLAAKLQAEAKAVALLDPRLRRVGPAVLAAAKRYGVSASYAQAVLARRDLMGLLSNVRSQEQAEHILDSALARDRFDRFLARYPRNAQGDLLRDVAGNILVRSGKSIEEVSRDGVFVYADFNGRSLTKASVGRDPDPTWPNVLFYVRFEDGGQGRWRIDVYRQNRGRGFPGGADAGFVEAFAQWLVSGGIPKTDLR